MEKLITLLNRQKWYPVVKPTNEEILASKLFNNAIDNVINTIIKDPLFIFPNKLLITVLCLSLIFSAITFGRMLKYREDIRVFCTQNINNNYQLCN